MKTLKRLFAAVALLFVVSVQFANAQSLEDQWRAFFRSDDNLPYRTICRLAHPTNDFVSGSLYLDQNNYIIVTIYSEDSDGSYTLKVRLHFSSNGRPRFDSITKISDNDFPSAWFAARLIKMAADDIFEDYHSETLTLIEDMYGQRLRDMNPQELTLAALTLLLWGYGG